MEFRHRFSACEQTESRPANRSRKGFTLVELLVVIAIIGVLVALLLPAIQAAREAARRAQCKNNVKQLALAAVNYESSVGHLPSGGWGFAWMGDPNLGNGKNQPGGWFYGILPFLEQTQVAMIGRGVAYGPLRKAALGQQMATIIPGYYCPTRRPAIGYPGHTPAGTSPDSPIYNVADAAVPPLVGKSDYAANGGEGSSPGLARDNGMADGCDDLNNPSWRLTTADSCGGRAFSADNGNANSLKGIVAIRSAVELRQVSDGTSNTVLVGEKFLRPSYYDLGVGPDAQGKGGNSGDNSACYQGHDWDNSRFTGQEPAQDTDENVGNRDTLAFGSAHAAGFNAALVDGSVQSYSYDIDPAVWSAMGSIADGD